MAEIRAKVNTSEPSNKDETQDVHKELVSRYRDRVEDPLCNAQLKAQLVDTLCEQFKSSK